MKINYVVILLIILLNVSLVVNVYLLTRPEIVCEIKWCRDETYSWERLPNGDHVFYNYWNEEIDRYTKEQLNKLPKPFG